MTNAELINVLSNYPEDARVTIARHDNKRTFALTVFDEHSALGWPLSVTFSGNAPLEFRSWNSWGE